MTLIKPADRKPFAEIIGHDKVMAVVSEFYDLIQTHPTLSKPFSIVGNWPEHKIKIGEFWWTALGGKPTQSFKYDPVNKHFHAGFTDDLLNDWKKLFKEVLDRHLEPKLSNQWFDRVELIGTNLSIQNHRLISSGQAIKKENNDE
jgi:hemoglobin